MGADTFYVEGRGRTALEAFNDLVEAARYSNGYEGYTGTIAEKDSYSMISIEHEADRAIQWLTESLADCTVAAHKRRLKDGDEVVWPRQGETLAQACARERKRIREQIKRLRTKKHRASAVVQFLLNQDYNRFGKWQPAGCIKLTERKRGKNTYAFFGWASC